MGRIIFRRIAGRLVPLHVERQVIATARAGAKDVTYKLRHEITKAGHEVGSFWAGQSNKRPHRFHVGAYLEEAYRGNGLGKEFYKKMAAQVQKLGGKFLVGTTDNVKVVKNVREAVGKTRAFSNKGHFAGITHVTMLKRKK